MPGHLVVVSSATTPARAAIAREAAMAMAGKLTMLAAAVAVPFLAVAAGLSVA